MTEPKPGQEVRIPGPPSGGAASTAPQPGLGVGWRYEAYILAISALTFVGKLLLARDITASALFADDYIYLSHAVGRPDSLVTVGGRFLYSWLLAPVRWVDDPAWRFATVLGFNGLLAAGFVYSSARALVRLTGRRSWLAPPCLAFAGSYSVYGLYALTENLLFLLLALAVWVLAAGSGAFVGPRFSALLALVALAPLCRLPGMAVACGSIAALLALPRGHLPGRRWTRAILLVGAAVVPYVLSGSGGAGESTYLRVVSGMTDDLGHLLGPLRHLPAQVPYLLLAGGIWMLPVAVRWIWTAARGSGPGWARQRVTAVFVMVASLVFLLFSTAHLFARQVTAQDPPFFFIGRYLDPIVVLVTLAGLAGLYALPPLGRASATASLLVVGATTWVSLLFLAGTTWRPIGFAGIILLTGSWRSAALVLASLSLAGGAWWWSQTEVPRRVSRGALLIAWGAFQLASLAVGFGYISVQSARVTTSQEVARWLYRESPADALVCTDQTILREAAPGAIEGMANVYRALTFSLYPRRVLAKAGDESLAACDFFFTARIGDRVGRQDEPGLEEVWSNEHYVLFAVARLPGARVRLRDRRGNPDGCFADDARDSRQVEECDDATRALAGFPTVALE